MFICWDLTLLALYKYDTNVIISYCKKDACIFFFFHNPLEMAELNFSAELTLASRLGRVCSVHLVNEKIFSILL